MFDISELNPPGRFAVRDAAEEGVEARDNLKQSLLAHPEKVAYHSIDSLVRIDMVW